MAIEREGLTSFVKSLADCEPKERTQILDALNHLDYKELSEMNNKELEEIISKSGFSFMSWGAKG